MTPNREPGFGAALGIYIALLYVAGAWSFLVALHQLERGALGWAVLTLVLAVGFVATPFILLRVGDAERGNDLEKR